MHLLLLQKFVLTLSFKRQLFKSALIMEHGHNTNERYEMPYSTFTTCYPK